MHPVSPRGPWAWRRAASALALAAAALLPGASCADDTIPLQVEVRGREVAPGEPVRVVVGAPEPLESAGARFLGDAVFLVRESDRRFSGWSLVPLDAKPGPATIDIRGATADGRGALGTLAVVVQPKEFPVEQLSVESRYVTPPPEIQARLDREQASLAAIYAARSARPPAREPFVRPVPGEATSVFGTRRVFNGEPRSPHPGLDLRAAAGTPVAASGPAVVVLADDLYYSGKTVILDHGGGLFTIYAHLSKIRVREGEEVTRGEIVALSGSTGRVTGPHLHWGAKVGDRPFNPTALLDASLY